MPTLATRFSLLLAGLRAVIAPVAARDRARTALLVLLWVRLGHMATRFERLFTRWRNGTLPRSRVTSPGVTRPSPSHAPRPTAPRLPQGQAWLLHQLREAAPSASQLQHFVATPELAAFLADVPQAGRLLRPLCRMLGITLPPVPASVPATPEPTPAQPPLTPAPRLSAAEPTHPGTTSFLWAEFFPPA